MRGKILTAAYAARHQWARDRTGTQPGFATLTQAKQYAARVTAPAGESLSHVEILREVWYSGRIFPEFTPIVTVLKRRRVQP